MCDESNSQGRHREQMHTLKQIERLLLSTTEHDDEDITALVSATKFYAVDYRGHRRLYALSTVSVTLTVEDIDRVFIPANTWTDIGFQEGQRLFSPDTQVTLLVRATDRMRHTVPNSGEFVGPALKPYAGNPTQTASAGADTIYNWGINGNREVGHVVIQNNTAASIFYAFDQSTTGTGNQVYTLAASTSTLNSIIFWDRAVTTLHFSSAAQQSFGGTTGITVEGFL